MSIVITKQPTGGPFNAYDAGTELDLEFGVDAGTPEVAIITINDVELPNIYPDINGNFYYNLKAAVTAIINENHFNDELEVIDENFKEDPSLFKEIEIVINVLFVDVAEDETTIVLPFLKSIGQKYYSEEFTFLVPKISQNAEVIYYKGYPMDIAIYSKTPTAGIRTYTIKNKRTGISTTKDFVKGVSRLFLGDGVVDLNDFEQEVPLYLGANDMEFSYNGSIVATLTIHKKEASCGKLLKWFNPAGGWSYFRFLPFEIDDLSSDTMENFNNHGVNTITGKEAERELELNTGVIDAAEYRILETLLLSPKVYIYDQKPFQPFALSNFKEVEVTTKSLSRATKYQTGSYTIKLLMPNVYTQTL
ncbi:hypothetical protein INR75_06675 [Zunongwangia sp. SCSIO 43204]|uniref:hypothetical protein n=1 Tax=Zunongwangia sp. SCSIO 43204 TaxID=2779359 RepID=UPI001CAA37EE|nr:hypothetical protein [Zunongwangia sp. SCSIO 43204]UAB85693.1 hypothetical protein INR75_06675 [Zunongwangia sp. SCSIO 43204]